MRNLLVLVFMLISSLGFGQYFYDGPGRQVARFDDNRVCNASSKQIGRIDADKIYDGSGRQIERVDGNYYYDGGGKQIGRVDGKYLYGWSGKLINRLDGDYLYDGSGKPIGRANGLTRMQMIIFFYYFPANKAVGNCTLRNSIVINTEAMKLPFSLIDYLIGHELRH